MLKNLIEYLFTNAKEIWHRLKLKHKGTTKIKESTFVLMHKYELVKMKDSETISETCSLDIVSGIRALGENILVTN